MVLTNHKIKELVMYKVLLVLVLGCISGVTQATERSEGKISTIYANAKGNLLIGLDGGFSVEAQAECPTSNGLASVPFTSGLRSVLLDAYEKQAVIAVYTRDCDASNPSWLGLYSVFVSVPPTP